MVLILTSDDKMFGKLQIILSKSVKPVDIRRVCEPQYAFGVMGLRTIDCFIVVENRLASGRPPEGVKFIEIIRKTDTYRFTPVIYISEIPDAFGVISNTYLLSAYLDSGFDPVVAESIILTAASHRTRRENRRLFVFAEGVIYLPKTEEIEYVRSDGHCFIIGCCDKECLVTRSFKNLDEVLVALDSGDFVKCSKNALCNVRHIKCIDRSNNIIRMDCGEMLKVGRIYKEKLIEILTCYVSEVA
ncbi:MAG: LytTR family transcriptional regulator [Lachnospiraceae bacterium]|nr:LytTR family transcriptional regulator [Lachnospiraceae bacterium]